MPEEVTSLVDYIAKLGGFGSAILFIYLVYRGEFVRRYEHEAALAREAEWKRLYMELLETTRKAVGMAEKQ